MSAQGPARTIESVRVEQDDAVIVELDCGHRRHVRHRPPLSSHPWITSATGRTSRIGTEIECGRCAALLLPEGLTAYKRTATFDEASLPSGLKREHTTTRRVWARIVVEEGEVDYVVPALDSTETLRPGADGVVAPQLPHHLKLRGPVRLHVEFLRVADRDDADAGC